MSFGKQWVIMKSELIAAKMLLFQFLSLYRSSNNLSNPHLAHDCPRQNIEYLTKTGKPHSIKSSGKNILYFKSEISK